MTSLPDTPPAALYHEPYRPQFHYSAPRAWLNDPNGLVYFEGEYHLFYQHHPNDVVWGPMHWGHAVSQDLIHWETLPIALYPDEHGTIFSGCIVVDADNTSGLVPGGGLVAVYSYHTQAQGVAYSRDCGRTWVKYDGNPVVPALRQDFRDPKIIRHAERWVMVIAAGHTLMLLRSADLLHWEPLSEFEANPGGGTWEVPDLFPVEVEGVTKWVLLTSVNPAAPAGGGGMRYFIGEFDGTTFTDDYPDQTLWFDWGADHYAGITFSGVADERHLLIAWMNNWAYADRIPTSVWRGAMTIPRELALIRTAEGLRISQQPVSALDGLRKPITRWENRVVEGTMPLDPLNAPLLDIECEFELANAERFGLDLFVTETSRVRIAYAVKEARLIFSRPNAGIRDFNPEFSAPLAPIDNRLRFRILVDHSSVELFANGGLLAMTSQVFPERGAGRVQLFAENGTVKVLTLRASALESIWKNAESQPAR